MARNYYRSFFTLREDNPTYAKAGRSALGKCVIERIGRGGRVSIYVQDLKPQVQYRLYLIRSGEDKSYAAFMGPLEIGAKNRCDARFEFDADDVGGHGFPVEEFDVAAVFVEGAGNEHEKHAFTTPLVGYKNGYAAFAGNLCFEAAETDARKIETPETQIVDNIDINNTAPEETEFVKSEEPSVNDSQKHVYGINFEQAALPDGSKMEEAAEQQEEPTGISFVPFDETRANDDIQRNFRVMAERINRELDELKTISLKTETAGNTNILESAAIPATAPYIENREIFTAADVFTHNTPMSPFGADDKETEWVRFSPRECALLQMPAMDYETNLFIAAGHYRFNHLILGKNRSDGAERFILGVPDSYCSEDRRHAEKLGFSSFRACGGENAPGAYGYWLMHV